MPRTVSRDIGLSLLLVAASGCTKPVPIRSPYGQVPAVEPLEPMVMLTIRDMRGRRVSSSAQTTTVDLPDTSSTTYGHTTYATTTYGTNEITVTTGNILGTDFVEDLDAQIANFTGRSGAFGQVQIVDVDSLVAVDDQNLERLADQLGVDRVAIVELTSYSFESDADAKGYLWATLGGLTLGLALPFIPLERWNAAVHLTGDVYLWEAGRGLVSRVPLDLDYYQRGPGIPSYRRVLSGVSTWADTMIAEEILDAVAAATDQA